MLGKYYWILLNRNLTSEHDGLNWSWYNAYWRWKNIVLQLVLYSYSNDKEMLKNALDFMVKILEPHLLRR